jgi:hypothetical protein
MSMDNSPLAGWDNFYVIVGSAAAGLTGLTFVVIALVRDADRVRLSGLRAYVTPTIVHFSGVLALSAFVSMPHQHPLSLAAGFGAGGIAGLAYVVAIARGIRSQEGYEAVWEDWFWHVIAPFLSYGCLGVVALSLWRFPQASLFAVAVAALLLLFSGIHNAWDIAVWMATKRRDGGNSASDPPPAPSQDAPSSVSDPRT